MKACWCTNQCPGCGRCCQVDCGCRRRTTRYGTGAGTTSPRPLTEEDIRRLIREYLEQMEKAA